MAEVPAGDAPHAERSELEVLRRRAYGPDADIFDDPRAVSRLSTLEERARMRRELSAAASDETGRPSVPTIAAPETPAPDAGVVPASVPVARSTGRRPRGHTALLAGTAVLAVVLGAAAWGSHRFETLPSGYAKTAAVALENRALSYEVGYERYLDGLRDQLLAAPGMQQIAGRLIREQLRPYGALYGRSVGVGPTVDAQICMVVVGDPEPSIACVPVDGARSDPVSVVLPSGHAGSAGENTAPEKPVRYTLLPSGGVVAVPASAVPPPGWQ